MEDAAAVARGDLAGDRLQSSRLKKAITRSVSIAPRLQPPTGMRVLDGRPTSATRAIRGRGQGSALLWVDPDRARRRYVVELNDATALGDGIEAGTTGSRRKAVLQPKHHQV